MLYERIIGRGTINEPKGKPVPHFALPSTVNWMRALRLIVEDSCLDFNVASSFYGQQNPRKMAEIEQNTVFEQLFLGLHHLSALEQFQNGEVKADFARIGILAWYYGVSNAASAMLAAQSGSFKEDHASTARLWDEQIAGRGLAMEPFGWRVSSLVKKTYEDEVGVYRQASDGKLLYQPKTLLEAYGAAAEYLSGSAKWYMDEVLERIKRSDEFKQLNVKDFRTKAAKELRDQKLRRKSIGFVHQASRYRGKANYREALFLAYGQHTEATLSCFVEDMGVVLRGFLIMAGAFTKRKIGKELWGEFVNDVDCKRAFSSSASDIWV